MAGVAQEAAAVGQHADEVAQQAQAGQGLHLLVHAVVSIAEPPGGAQLDLAGDLVVLERAQDGAQHIKVGGVQAVQDDLRAGIGLGQCAQQAADGGTAIGHGNHVKAGVGAELAVHLVIDVAQAAVMNLHSNVVFLVGSAQFQQQVGGVGVALLLGQRLAGHSLLERGGRLLGIGINVGDIVQAVVRSAAAHLDEEFQALFQGADNAVGAGKLAAHDLFQLVDVVGEALLADVQGLVGAEGRSDDDLDGGVLLDLLVPLEGVNGVVGGTDHGDVALLDQAADGQFRVVLQLLVAEVPDFLGSLAVQHALIAEVLLQLEVAPGIHRVADGHFQALGKLLEALAVGLVAGDILLGHAVGTHHAPLVVVTEVVVAAVGQDLMAAQPDLRNILKTAVLINFLRGNMAVIVDDGQLGRIIMVQVLRGGGLQQKVLIHKRFHVQTLLHYIHYKDDSGGVGTGPDSTYFAHLFRPKTTYSATSATIIHNKKCFSKLRKLLVNRNYSQKTRWFVVQDAESQKRPENCAKYVR